MADPGSVKDPDNEVNLGYTQALKYGQDLARLYTLEKAKRRELELANQKLQAILGTAPNGLAVLDEEMTIVEANPCFEALVGQDGGCVGRSLADVLPSSDLTTLLKTASQEGKRFVEIEATVPKPIGHTLHAVGAQLSAGDQHGWVISLHDITERKRLEGLKEEFINIAAHELRTPLAIILGYASILRDEDTQASDNPLVASATDSIITAAGQLAMVIDELVGFAAAKSRSSDEVGADRFNLWELIRHAVNAVTHQADLKNVKISVESCGEPLMVNGDRVILAQSVGHLLDNAVKFNRPGGQVRVKAFQADGETILEVEDTGIGIPITESDKIFDMFYQMEGHLTRAEGGLGMGLAIARRGVELHGGRISVESTPGQGSRFRVTFPPSVEQTLISPQTRLDTAHQQTLAYGRDLARAFAAQQSLAQRMDHMVALSNQLLDRLEQLSPEGTEEKMDRLLEEARALARQLIDHAAR
ncbi:MAG: PAS domain-containing sensor histidine kinase [Anaerolineales bacterium]|nr:MAG: PAS domain-containing sensor histidine kinase [Anaerolineales bacterium]